MIQSIVLKRIAFLAPVLLFATGLYAVPVEVGQSFTPKLSGSTPDTLPAANDFVTLTDFTFVTSGGLPTTLYITSSLPTSTSTIASEAIATSSNNYTDIANDSRFSNLATRVYHFTTGATLDTDLTYYALFGTSVSNLLSLSSSNPYASGSLYALSGTTYVVGPTGYDALSGATFAAIPEPATCSALAGLAVMGLIACRRRRT
jgi:hypothetical protein